MSRQVFEIDSNGFFTGDALIDDNEKEAPHQIKTQPIGFFRPRWDGEQWTEGDPTGRAAVEKENEDHRRRQEATAAEREAAHDDNDDSVEGLARRVLRLERLAGLK